MGVMFTRCHSGDSAFPGKLNAEALRALRFAER